MSIRTYPTQLLVNTGRVILRQAAVMSLVAYKKVLGYITIRSGRFSYKCPLFSSSSVRWKKKLLEISPVVA